jgi:hypothetical protein
MLYIHMHRVLECGRVSEYSHTKILCYFLCHVAEMHVRSIVNSSIFNAFQMQRNMRKLRISLCIPSFLN